jgi:hypothetical protein
MVITTVGIVVAVVLLLGILGYISLLLLIWNDCSRNSCSAVINWPICSQFLPGQNIANDQLVDPKKTAIPLCQIRSPDEEFCAFHKTKCRLSVTEVEACVDKGCKDKGKDIDSHVTAYE